MTVDRVLITPEMIAAQPGRFGVRSARLEDATSGVSFAQTLAAKDTGAEATSGLDQLRGAWPVDGEITSEFGPRQLLPGESEHTGIDIAVPTGTPVHATADGVVQFVGNTDGYGNRVEIQHADGTVTLYAHNSELLVQPGQTVSKGDVIALSGSTGASTGPHVHYEIRSDGVPIDPWPLMSADPTSATASIDAQPVSAGMGGNVAATDDLAMPDTPFADLIAGAASRYGIDPALIAAVIQAESSFDPDAVSPAGAKGLMQLMDGTAADLGVEDAFDPAQSIDGGAHYIQEMLDRFGGDVSLALAAYNAGPGAVASFGGIPPYAETRAYVNNVLATYHALAGTIATG